MPLNWNLTTLTSVATLLGRTVVPGGVFGCCTPALWCKAGVCGTQAFSETVDVGGWLPLDTAAEYRPVYTCVNGSALSYNASVAVPVPTLTSITPSVLNSSANTAVYIEGNDLGNNSALMAVEVGVASCVNPFPCHTICTPCNASLPAACPSSEVCYVPSTAPTGSDAGVCVPACTSSWSCPCGATCQRVFDQGTGVSRALCLNPDFAGAATACNTSFSFQPSLESGANSRVQCTVYANARQCATSLPHAVAFSNNGVLAVTAPQSAAIAPNLTFSVTRCNTTSQCGDATLCYASKCVLGCCELVPTGRCDSNDGTNNYALPVLDGGFVMLPPQTANGFDLPDLKKDAHTYLSSVSYVDDVPMEQINLAFPYNFFGSSVSTLYLSANGYLQTNAIPQCGGYFAGSDCDFISAYKGLLGPLVADYDATISWDAEVWVRRDPTNGSLCVQWQDMPLFRSSRALRPNETVYTSSICLYPSGALRWKYKNFTAPPTTAMWMVRLRKIVYTCLDTATASREFM